MNTSMLTRARELWFRDYLPDHICRANARKWARSLRVLGDKWLLAKPVERSA